MFSRPICSLCCLNAEQMYTPTLSESEQFSRTIFKLKTKIGKGETTQVCNVMLQAVVSVCCVTSTETIRLIMDGKALISKDLSLLKTEAVGGRCEGAGGGGGGGGGGGARG